MLKFDPIKTEQQSNLIISKQMHLASTPTCGLSTETNVIQNNNAINKNIINTQTKVKNSELFMNVIITNLATTNLSYSQQKLLFKNTSNTSSKNANFMN